MKCALAAGVPIVPLAHIGSEEIFYVSKQKTDFFIKNDLINYEIPYVIFKPLPYKVYEVFGKPIYLDYPPSAAKDEEILLECFDRVKSEFLALMHRGLALKQKRAQTLARKWFNSEHPRLVNLLRPYC